MAKASSYMLFAFVLLFGLLSVAVNAQPLFEDHWSVSSSDGVLNVLLVDELSNVTVAGGTVELRVWNQSFTGPVLRCKRGDVVNIYLVNKLDQPTNLHFHGFHVSPQIPADDSAFTLGAFSDKTKLYTFTVPDDHPQGLFWYHSHAMPDSEWQIFNGMSGAFIIEGMLDNIPQLASIPEKLILLRDLQIVDGTIPTQDAFVGEDDTTRLVNGEVFPTLSCPINQTQLWSFANIGADISYLLALESEDGSISNDFTMWLIARDGVLLSEKVLIDDQFLLGPANRAQFLVECPTQAVNATLVSRNFTNGLDLFPRSDLIQLDVSAAVSAPLDLSNLQFATHRDYRQANITRVRTIVFSQATEDEGAAEGAAEGGEEEEGSFFINNKAFRKGRVDQRVFLGAIERWYVINVSPEAHYFHIHQGHFQVVSVNGVEQPFRGYVDTVLVDIPPKGGNTTVEVIIPFTEKSQVGKYLLHCHIEAHADGGMMQTIQVMESAHVDVVFVAISLPVLFLIFVVSTGYLGLQYYREKDSTSTVGDNDSEAQADVDGSFSKLGMDAPQIAV